MEILILLCGLYNICFALFHIFFWKIFRWNKDLKKLTFPNDAIIQILNIQIIYFFLFIAVICFTFPTELRTTKLGNIFLIGNSLFWFLRTIQQFVFLRVNNFKVHILTLIFFLGTIIFALPVLLS